MKIPRINSKFYLLISVEIEEFLQIIIIYYYYMYIINIKIEIILFAYVKEKKL